MVRDWGRGRGENEYKGLFAQAVRRVGLGKRKQRSKDQGVGHLRIKILKYKGA